MEKPYKIIMSPNYEIYASYRIIHSREQESRGWLGDLKGIGQEQGPVVSAPDFLSRERISLPEAD